MRPTLWLSASRYVLDDSNRLRLQLHWVNLSGRMATAGCPSSPPPSCSMKRPSSTTKSPPHPPHYQEPGLQEEPSSDEDPTDNLFSHPGGMDCDRHLSMSFAGCGFLGIYHLGAAQTFQRHGRALLRQVDCFTGASAGALVAAILAIKGEDGKTMQDCIDFTYNLARGVQKHRLGLLTPGLSLLDSLRDFLMDELPADAHSLASERLFVSLTHSRSKRNLIVSQYHSKEDLIQCLLATSYVPHITGKKPVIRNGKKYIDGGMSDNLPILTKGRTICISPFSGRYDVCPSDMTGAGYHININRQDFQVNYQNMVRGLHAFFPPKPVLLQTYFHKGVRDATRFLMRENLYELSSDASPNSSTTSPSGNAHDLSHDTTCNGQDEVGHHRHATNY